MKKRTKFIAAGIITITIILAFIAGWKFTDSIRQSIRQDLQTSFKDELCKYGKK